MSWTDERIDSLKTMWEAGQTASQIAEALGGVSRNAVIGKAHRLGLQSRPSPVKSNEAKAAELAAEPAVAAPAAEPSPAPVAEPTPVTAKVAPVKVASVKVAPVKTTPVKAAPVVPPVAEEAVEDVAVEEPEEDDVAVIADDAETDDADDGADDGDIAAPAAPPPPPPPILRSVGPGGFLRQAPGEQQAPITPAPPRRLVPAKPSADMATKTSLLDLNDRICKWPIGHPGEPDFHFCGDKVNPGFPYCIQHCGHAYQAQLPRRDRRPAPPLPFGGPRVR